MSLKLRGVRLDPVDMPKARCELRSSLLSQGRDRHETAMYTAYIDEKLEHSLYVRQKKKLQICVIYTNSDV